MKQNIQPACFWKIDQFITIHRIRNKLNLRDAPYLSFFMTFDHDQTPVLCNLEVIKLALYLHPSQRLIPLKKSCPDLSTSKKLWKRSELNYKRLRMEAASCNISTDCAAGKLLQSGNCKEDMSNNFKLLVNN